MPAHTHDGIDWVARLVDLRQADEVDASAIREVARRLIDALPARSPSAPQPTVVDVGSGAGGMSAALAAALAARGGGTLILVDAVPELLAAATEAATRAAEVAAGAADAAVGDAVGGGQVGGDATAGDEMAGDAGDGDSAGGNAGHATAAAGDASATEVAAWDGDGVAREPAGGDAGAVGAAAVHGSAAAVDASVTEAGAGAGDVVAGDPAGSDAGHAHSAGVHATVAAGDASVTVAGAGAGDVVAGDPAGSDAGHAHSAGVHATVAAGDASVTEAGAGAGDVVAGDPAGSDAGAAAVHAAAAAGDAIATQVGADAAGADGRDGRVRVRGVLADLTDTGQIAGLPAADLVWASRVVHHLPDQRLGLRTLVGLLAPGGRLALAEGGLGVRCLPWDLGIGEPGLQDRLAAAQTTWFRTMRTEMAGSVRMPVGWNRALADAGLTGVSAFSFLVDAPAPVSDLVRASVVRWLTWMTSATEGILADADTTALHRLIDPDDPAFVGARDDIFLLKADTVYCGYAPAPAP